MTIPPGYFKENYDLAGKRNWLQEVSPEDKAAFVRVGQAASDYGRAGGRARAATAKRDWKGRFAGNGEKE